MSNEPERNKIIYVTADLSSWAILDEPFGLISPPTIELHEPQVGTVTFYNASSYQLHIPAEAKMAAK
jgi:hypothetical protein